MVPYPTGLGVDDAGLFREVQHLLLVLHVIAAHLLPACGVLGGLQAFQDVDLVLIEVPLPPLVHQLLRANTNHPAHEYVELVSYRFEYLHQPLARYRAATVFPNGMAVVDHCVHHIGKGGGHASGDIGRIVRAGDAGHLVQVAQGGVAVEKALLYLAHPGLLVRQVAQAVLDPVGQGLVGGADLVQHGVYAGVSGAVGAQGQAAALVVDGLPQLFHCRSEPAEQLPEGVFHPLKPRLPCGAALGVDVLAQAFQVGHGVLDQLGAGKTLVDLLEAHGIEGGGSTKKPSLRVRGELVHELGQPDVAPGTLLVAKAQSLLVAGKLGCYLLAPA